MEIGDQRVLLNSSHIGGNASALEKSLRATEIQSQSTSLHGKHYSLMDQHTFWMLFCQNDQLR